VQVQAKLAPIGWLRGQPRRRPRPYGLSSWAAGLSGCVV